MSLNKITRVVLVGLIPVTIVAVLLKLAIWKHPTVVHAQSNPVTTGFGNITGYMAGWYNNIVMVTTNVTYVDNGCGGQATQQYSTLDGVEGNPAFHAALLGALLSNKKVAITVQGCAYGHPEIVGVNIQP